METGPKHVAIIPDGNRRWAKERGLNAIKGHEKSTALENIKSLVEEAIFLGIKHLSIWGFSTENWKRPEAEKKFLFKRIIELCGSLEEYAEEKSVRFRHIGRKDRLPKDVIKKLDELENKTEKFGNISVQFFLDYGGRDEIVRTVNKLTAKGKKIEEKDFLENLDTAGIPEPELIIRTGGEKRLSGLMPFQSVYAELYFTEIYFPDFSAEELRKAVSWFNKIERRFGE